MLSRGSTSGPIAASWTTLTRSSLCTSLTKSRWPERSYTVCSKTGTPQSGFVTVTLVLLQLCEVSWLIVWGCSCVVGSELATTPLLVLANKIDLEPHISEPELIRELNLDYIVDNPWLVIPISALRLVNIDQVIQWLMKQSGKG